MSGMKSCHICLWIYLMGVSLFGALIASDHSYELDDTFSHFIQSPFRSPLEYNETFLELHLHRRRGATLLSLLQTASLLILLLSTSALM